MKKILLYFVLFYLNFCHVNAAMHDIDREFEEIDMLCRSIVSSEQKKGYLQRSAWYVSQAINLSKDYLKGNIPYTEKENMVKRLNDDASEAARNFVQARVKVVSLAEIDEYFSKKLSLVEGETYLDFGAYLKSNKIGCRMEDLRQSIWDCYLKNRVLDEKRYAFLITKDAPQEKKEGYLGLASCCVNQAIQIREGGPDASGNCNSLLDNAAQNFTQALHQEENYSDIDIYFSTKIYFKDKSQYKSFLSYLLDNRRPNASDSQDNDLTKITVEDTKKAMWHCYLKNRTLDKEYYESLIKSDNPLEKRKEGYFGLAAYYLNGVINDAKGQTSLSETHKNNLKTASGNFIVAFNYLDRTFDEVKKYQDVEKYFSQKIQFLDSEDIKVKHYDFGYAIKQALQQEKLSISEITDDHIFKLMLKVYFGIDYKEGGCLIM